MKETQHSLRPVLSGQSLKYQWVESNCRLPANSPGKVFKGNFTQKIPDYISNYSRLENKICFTLITDSLNEANFTAVWKF